MLEDGQVASEPGKLLQFILLGLLKNHLEYQNLVLARFLWKKLLYKNWILKKQFQPPLFQYGYS